MIQVKTKRIYEPVVANDGFRILVDRLWPRGIKKENAKIDIWFKEIAPSPSLRKWFNHEPGKWKEFRKSYREELEQSAAIEELMQYIKAKKRVTLLYAARDEKHNHAPVLEQYIKKRFSL